MGLPDELLDRIVAQLGEDGPRHARCVNHALRRAVDERSPQLHEPTLRSALGGWTAQHALRAPYLAAAWQRLEEANVFVHDLTSRNEKLQTLARRSPRLRHLGVEAGTGVRLALLRSWPALARLQLRGSPEPEHIALIAALPALDTLILDGVTLRSDAELMGLSAFTRLTRLEVTGLWVSPNGSRWRRSPAPLAVLAALPSLRTLSLGEGPFGEWGPPQLASASRELAHLTVPQALPPCYVTHLQASCNLVHLQVPRAEPWVASLTGLTELRLREAEHITDATLGSLAALASLRALDLGSDIGSASKAGLPFTVAGMQALAALRGVTRLVLRGCSLEHADAAIHVVGAQLIRFRWHPWPHYRDLVRETARSLEACFSLHAFARGHDVMRLDSCFGDVRTLLLLSVALEPGTDAARRVSREETDEVENGLFLFVRRHVRYRPGRGATAWPTLPAGTMPCGRPTALPPVDH